MESPWFCRGETIVAVNGAEPEVLPEIVERHLYAYEIESFTNDLGGQPIGARAVGMRLDDTMGNIMRWTGDVGDRSSCDKLYRMRRIPLLLLADNHQFRTGSF